MAERRMFSKTIIDSDAFLEMPLSTQALYFHLSMRADDDGFVSNPRRIMQMIGAGNDDAKVLLAKRFILEFESGVIVIKHWRINNYIQKDRYKPTNYTEEKSQLQLENNGAYTDKKTDVYILDTQDSIDKDSIDKNSKEEFSFIKEKEEKENLDTNFIKEHLNYNPVLDDEEPSDTKVFYSEINQFIKENNLEHLNPVRYYSIINTENIDNWQEYLRKENAKVDD